MNIYIIWQMFLACAAYSIMTRWSAHVNKHFTISYLCERHVSGNSRSLFWQKPLFLLSEHNLFKLELEREKTKNIFESSVPKGNKLSLPQANPWNDSPKKNLGKKTDLVCVVEFSWILCWVLYGQSAGQLAGEVLLHRLSHQVILHKRNTFEINSMICLTSKCHYLIMYAVSCLSGVFWRDSSGHRGSVKL